MTQQEVISYINNPPAETPNDDGSVTQFWTNTNPTNGDVYTRTHVATADEYQKLQAGVQDYIAQAQGLLLTTATTFQTSKDNLSKKNTINTATK